jgi:dihydroneopterin aldolase
MRDSLTIDSLELWTHIGMGEEERRSEQRLLVTIAMELAHEGPHGDDLRRSIDYEQVVAHVRTEAKRERHTLECFAEEAAAMILGNFQPRRVRITVKKFALPGVAGTSLTIERP